jgi:hypothetical protein
MEDTLVFVASTCVVFFSTTLVIIGELLRERNGRGVVVVGGSMLVVNMLMTRYHYRRVCSVLDGRDVLPLTQVNGTASDRAVDPDSADETARARESLRDSRRARRKQRGPDGELLTPASKLLYASPSRRKAAKRAKLKRKKEREGAARSGGLAGLGIGTRLVRS